MWVFQWFDCTRLCFVLGPLGGFLHVVFPLSFNVEIDFSFEKTTCVCGEFTCFPQTSHRFSMKFFFHPNTEICHKRRIVGSRAANQDDVPS